MNGIGYELFVPFSSYERLPPVEHSCRLLTYDHVREDQHALYGFVSEDERSMFLLLMSVNGIGPKLALGTLSGMTVRELRSTIAKGDSKRLSSIPGIGKKTAERIIVDLRDKISAGEAAEAGSGEEPGDSAEIRDSMLALVSLGYKQVEARKMIVKAMASKPPPANVEEIVRLALSQ